jgi:hypothetical protein
MRMQFIAGALRLCGAVVTAAVFFSSLPVTPSLATDDLQIVGDITMPEVHVNVNVDDDIGPVPPPRPRIVYPRGSLAAVAPARFAPAIGEGEEISQLEVARMLRSTGYSLLGQINRRGWVYTVSVLNPRGDDGRAIIDARTGAIIRFIPAAAVNARLDDQLGVIYGPPGPPPVAQDISRAPRPPKGVPQADKRKAAPKLADRMPVSGPVTASSPVSAKPEKSNPADAHAEMKPASAPQPAAASTPP